MTPVNKQWENLKNDYIHQVEKALSSVKHPRIKEILEDVRVHLDSRFCELSSEEQNIENLKSIITEMGPASEYVELLEPQMKSGQRSRKKYVVAAGLAAIIILTLAICLPQLNSAQTNETIPGVGRIEDKIDYPFVNDPAVIGAWKTVDLVKAKSDFKPGKKRWKDELHLNHLIFKQNGILQGGIFTWTKDFIINADMKTASAYEIKNIAKDTYMFFEWKSGDYTIRRQKPSYYVLKQVALDDVKYEAMFGETVEIPSTSIIDENGYIIDKTDYPFINDSNAIGSWESVDFVEEIEDFEPGTKHVEEDLYFKELFVFEGGRTNWALKWTKGHMLSEDTDAKYIIKEINGEKYMFFEWKSGDYTIRHSKPSFYVLKKVDKPYIETRTEDKIDYPFVNDSEVIGRWKSVDFVETPEQFIPGFMQWKAGDLFLEELIFQPDGEMDNSQDKWTNGLVLDTGSKTASRYVIKKYNDSTYMFYEWKSGDYTIRGMKPKYYVLKKE